MKKLFKLIRGSHIVWNACKNIKILLCEFHSKTINNYIMGIKKEQYE